MNIRFFVILLKKIYKLIIATKDIQSRIGVKGQFLNWIRELPQTQLKNIDKIYNLAQEARKGGYTDLAILGIGGSRHTTEAMMKMLGKDSNVHFYSAVDGESFRKFTDGLDLDKTKFLVVSKSDAKTTNAVIKGVTTAYSKQHPVTEIEIKDFSPESIARFIELKHFETLYTGNMDAIMEM